MGLIKGLLRIVLILVIIVVAGFAVLYGSRQMLDERRREINRQNQRSGDPFMYNSTTGQTQRRDDEAIRRAYERGRQDEQRNRDRRA